MTADQIRAEIARLQEMLAQIEGGESGANDPSYTNWLQQQEQRFRNMGKYDYFEVKNGRLVYNPELARKSEYVNWQNQVKRSQEAQRKQSEIEKARLIREEQIEEQIRLNEERKRKAEGSERMRNLQLDQLLRRAEQDPNFVIPPMWQRLIDQRRQSNPTASPTPLPASVPPPSQVETSPQNMPPAWS